MSASPFRVSVADLLRAPGSSRRVTVETALDGVDVGAQAPVELPVTVTARFDALGEGVWVDGDVSGVYPVECVRCLEPAAEPFVLDFGELFGRDIAPGSDDGYPLPGDELDLEPLVRDVVLLGVPTHPLCDEDCAGLCAECGANRNDRDCGHAVASGHPALAALQDLFRSGELEPGSALWSASRQPSGFRAASSKEPPVKESR